LPPPWRRYADEGVRVMVVTMTGGERGDILNPAMDLPDVHGRITEIRRDEMARPPRSSGRAPLARFRRLRPAEVTRRHRYPTAASGWCRWRSPSRRWCAWSRKFRPHVMTTYDENGGYPHPDHIRTHQVSVAALRGRKRLPPVPRRR